MKIRLTVIAIAAAATAPAAVAQPDKDDRRPKTPPTTVPAPVVLASAGDVRRPSPTDADRPAEPVRRPAPRVTTCRCGDPQLSQEQTDASGPDQ
jgi:hypothetical protein